MRYFEFGDDSRELRSWQRAALLRIARVPLQHTGDADSVDYQRPDNYAMAHHRKDSPYGNLYEQLYGEYRDQAHGTGDKSLEAFTDGMDVGFGIGVLVTAISYGPSAYKSYAQRKGIPITVEDFEPAIRGSWRVTEESISSTDRRRATTYETACGLLGGGPDFEEYPFVFVDTDKSRHPILTISLYTQMMAESEVGRREGTGDLEPSEAHRVCPANGEVMRELWQRAVTIGLEPDGVLAIDLQTA